MREICFDTETTGLDPRSGDRITEIGCVEIVDRKITGNTYREIINPQRKNSLESIQITGLTDEILKDKPTFSEIADSFLEFISDSQLVAHNAGFDMNFVNYELGLLNIEPLKNSVVDSLEIAKVRFPGKKNNLNVLCERFHIDNSKREKHGALLDAELLAEVYLCLTREDSEFFSQKQEEVVEVIDFDEFLRGISSNEVLKSRPLSQPTNDDLEAHRAFMEKNFKSFVWKFD